MTESRYVTIDDIRNLIAEGESIQVIDSRDKNDITRSVLLQILAEQEAEGHGTVLTNRVIEQMIRFYGDQLGSVAARYIEQSIVAFLEHQEQLRAHLKQLNSMNPLNMMRQAFEDAAQDWPGTPTPPRGREQRDNRESQDSEDNSK